ncbi:metal-sensitive transcriptional regulator [Tepidiforma sp.]|uniref:metal-sensitive transcriptional regulator n=1 Tax=Tepidiforma sp. TaxID=2682230 RepID=UPI002ADDE98F|nr:metal-sensitive transcriptional regulator [Tepidiforma sp.]
MTPEEQKRLLDRLARVEGQVRGLRKMVEEQRCCEDVLTQLLAARSGLERAGVLLLERHLQDCVLGEAEVDPATAHRLREAIRLWTRHAGPVEAGESAG